ncbi:MAG: hypothetical protein ISS57_06575 [Anaerolineales bacterium]|nr:hypothetical protein [Anaerolineales bacterium]
MDNKKRKEVAALIRTIATESIRSSGDRLVLGRPDECIQNALDYGGFFIDAGPEVIKILDQAGIDPAIIYIEALKMKMEMRIPRIDFINIRPDAELSGKVDDWNADPSIAIQQMQWMIENAQEYGYQREGDSWILNDEYSD